MNQLSAVQEWLWSRRAEGAPVRAHVAAVRLSGHLDPQRLESALAEVAAALPMMRARFIEKAGHVCMVTDGPAPATIHRDVDGPDERCVVALRQDRDRQPDPFTESLVRFHLLRRTPDELVLALVADPLVLDEHSVYLVLGALMQAYFGRLRHTHYPPSPEAEAIAVTPRRRSWWSERLIEWYEEGQSRPPARAASSTVTLEFDADRWNGLVAAIDQTGNAGWLAVIASLTWWLRKSGQTHRPVVFAGTLDLREYLGLGPAIGPLTDRIAFAVEFDRHEHLTLRDLIRRVHAGVLDTVVHYVPYRDLVAIGCTLGAPPPPRNNWPGGFAVNYCRLPPTSAYTRGEATLASRGLSIELFRAADLAAGGATDAPVEVQLAESGAGMAVVVNFDSAVVPADVVESVLHGIEGVVDQVVADPAVALHQL